MHGDARWLVDDQYEPVAIELDEMLSGQRLREHQRLAGRRVEHADDDAPVVEALLGDLTDHEVRVIAVGRDDHGIGVLDAGLAQDEAVHAVPADEPAGPILSQAAEG